MQCQQSISQPQQAAAAAPAAPAATPQGLQCSFSMVTALAPLLTLGLLGGSLALPQQQQQDPCPVNPPKQAGTAASCALFCDGKCSYHPDYAPMKPTNLTAYRLTAEKMLQYGVGNKDTGDAAGDVGFYMSRFMSLVDCAPPWTRHGCFLDEQPVIQQFVIETDGVWGPYMKCNPLTTPQGVPIIDEPFLCNYGNQGPPQPVDPEHWGDGAKNAFYPVELFTVQNERLTKTGSGQTQEKLRKLGVFCVQAAAAASGRTRPWASTPRITRCPRTASRSRTASGPPVRRKTPSFEAMFILKTIILPRQAQDKHGKSYGNRVC